MTPKNIDFVEKSGVTAKGYRHRTTIPCKVFRKLKLKDKDELEWTYFKDGTLSVKKVV